MLLIRNSSKLKESIYRSVYINRDLTRVQREDLFAARRAAREAEDTANSSPAETGGAISDPISSQAAAGFRLNIAKFVTDYKSS